MVNKNDIITLKSGLQYIVIDICNIDNISYLLVDKVDADESLFDDYKILKLITTNNKMLISSIDSELELNKIKLNFVKKLEKNKII